MFCVAVSEWVSVWAQLFYTRPHGKVVLMFKERWGDRRRTTTRRKDCYDNVILYSLNWEKGKTISPSTCECAWVASCRSMISIWKLGPSVVRLSLSHHTSFKFEIQTKHVSRVPTCVWVCLYVCVCVCHWGVRRRSSLNIFRPNLPYLSIYAPHLSRLLATRKQVAIWREGANQRHTRKRGTHIARIFTIYIIYKSMCLSRRRRRGKRRGRRRKGKERIACADAEERSPPSLSFTHTKGRKKEGMKGDEVPHTYKDSICVCVQGWDARAFDGGNFSFPSPSGTGCCAPSSSSPLFPTSSSSSHSLLCVSTSHSPRSSLHHQDFVREKERDLPSNSSLMWVSLCMCAFAPAHVPFLVNEKEEEEKLKM